MTLWFCLQSWLSLQSKGLLLDRPTLFWNFLILWFHMIPYDPKPIEQAPEPVHLLCQLDKMNHALCNHMTVSSADNPLLDVPTKLVLVVLMFFLIYWFWAFSFYIIINLPIISPSVYSYLFYGTYERNSLFPIVNCESMRQCCVFEEYASEKVTLMSKSIPNFLTTGLWKNPLMWKALYLIYKTHEGLSVSVWLHEKMLLNLLVL